MLAILIAALAHHIEKQDAALRGVDKILGHWAEQAKRRYGAVVFAGGRKALECRQVWCRHVLLPFVAKISSAKVRKDWDLGPIKDRGRERQKSVKLVQYLFDVCFKDRR
jgi:hypothetical protein